MNEKKCIRTNLCNYILIKEIRQKSLVNINHHGYPDYNSYDGGRDIVYMDRY